MGTVTDEILKIELEDAGATSWWSSLLATLGSQSGSAYLRFVGRVGRRDCYTGASFAVPRTVGEVPPQEEWAPGMTESLNELRSEIEADGWTCISAGTVPWALSYRRTTAP